MFNPGLNSDGEIDFDVHADYLRELELEEEMFYGPADDEDSQDDMPEAN